MVVWMDASTRGGKRHIFLTSTWPNLRKMLAPSPSNPPPQPPFQLLLPSSTRCFSLEQLTPQFFFSQKAVLKVTPSTVLFAGVPEAQTTAWPDDIDLDLLDFKTLDVTDQVILFDVGQLLGDQIEDAGLVFQINTREGVYVLKARSKDQKADVTEFLKDAARTERSVQQTLSPLGESEAGSTKGNQTWDENVESISGVRELLENYTALCTQYEIELQEMRTQVDLQTQQFSTAEEQWNALQDTNKVVTLLNFLAVSSSNVNSQIHRPQLLLESLQTTQQRAEMLASRLEEVGRSSLESVDKVQVMQKRMDDNMRLLQDKSEILDTVKIYLESPASRAQWTLEWRTIAGSAVAVAFLAMFGHYLWLLKTASHEVAQRGAN
ncbi:hypothetical protein HKX48_005470 [Thoreauomyces humboldtii]|nr:hypothetical protein HKX48_005470 [Thoreauomyces humboldtii]